jgi:hypothetical protein
MLPNEKKWKERIILAWGRWQQQAGRHLASSSRFGSGTAIQRTRKRPPLSGGQMDKIFQQEKREEVDLTIGFFFLSQLHFI